jgi:DNA replication protein DnaC
MDEKLQQILKDLRLYGLLERWDETLNSARKGRYSHVRLLDFVLEQEWQIKRCNALKRRLKLARIPEPYVIATYPFHKQPRLNKKKILSLYDAFDYMTSQRNIIWVGPTGSGKTGMADSFLLQAIEQGYTGRHILFGDLITELYASVADHSQQKVLKKYASIDCLVVDELGYVETETEQAGLFFTLMQQRNKKKTTLITSNLGFKEWGSFLKNPHLTAALIDRLTQCSYVINMCRCRSIRDPLEPRT